MVKRIACRTAFLIFLPLILALSANVWGQTTITGHVSGENNEPLIGVSILVEGTVSGTITDTEGNFELKIKNQLPVTLLFSCVGYQKTERTVAPGTGYLNVTMKVQTLMGQEVVVSASRIEESIRSSPVTIEKLGLAEIREGSAANFYDDLYKLRGVDMNVSSLTFRFPNTRGFNGESNYRMNQFVDGVSNVSPGLSYAAGNMFGLSQIDLESVELITGASSALYGPGGINGTLLMTSKNPFEYQGLSFSAQTGLMHLNAGYRDNPAPMYDFSLRYAKAFNDKFAFKITGEYLSAIDWQAVDYRDRNHLDDPESTRENNPGYDGVNVYGDDIIVPINLAEVAPDVARLLAEQLGLTPGTPVYEDFVNRIVSVMPDQIVSRTGWKENELADTHTDNLKVSGALHYRINERYEAIAQVNYSRGNSIATAQNRFALNNFDILSGKLEVRSPSFYARLWGVTENTGDTYDIGSTALRVNEEWKPSEEWYTDYITAFLLARLTGKPEDEAFHLGRQKADNRDENGHIIDESKPALPLAGSEEMKDLWNSITSRPVNEGGSKIIDRSKIWQAEGVYDFSNLWKWMRVQLGFNYKRYIINSEATLFFDQPGHPIHINEYGSFVQLSKKILGDHLKLNLSARYDKNQYFKGVFTPRFTGVWSVDKNALHHIRASWQSAFRFPSISDQWIDIDIGYYTGVGGLPVVQEKYDFFTNPVYPLSGSNPVLDSAVLENGPFVIPEFGPEKVQTLELGYNGLMFNKKLYVDGYIYKNIYNGFLANQLLAQNPYTPQEKRYRTVISTSDKVSSYGWAVSLNLGLPLGFYFGGNVASNVLLTSVDTPGRETRYNTPKYRFNLSLGNHHLVRNLGFRVNFRWQEAFLWQSNFGTAEIPAYSTLDAQINYRVHKLKSIIKLGVTNLLNRYYTSSFGSASVGGLYYISWTFDQFLN